MKRDTSKTREGRFDNREEAMVRQFVRTYQATVRLDIVCPDNGDTHAIRTLKR